MARIRAIDVNENRPPDRPLPAGMIIRINLFCLLTGAQCCRSADAQIIVTGFIQYGGGVRHPDFTDTLQAEP